MPTDVRVALGRALPAYEIFELLGRGAYGVVYTARHRRLGRDVAVKQLPTAFGFDPEARERFLTEARLLAALDHPHIVPLYDFVEHEGLCLIVMELLTGGVVRQRRIDHALDPPASCAIAVATCAALHYAHGRGVLHRDVKPDNLIFSRDNVVKVTDFGIAKVLGDQGRNALHDGVIGTPAYMAPEQAKGVELAPATDVYAVGTVLYELLADRLPHPETDDPFEMLAWHLDTEPIPLGEAAPHLPARLTAVVDRAVARDMADRPSSAAEFAGALSLAGDELWGVGWEAASGVAVRARIR